MSMPEPCKGISKPESLADFAAALLRPKAPAPRGVVNPDGQPATKRFNVYRNNVIVGLIEALKVGFPVVEKLVGAQFFQAMAREYVLASPPSSPVLITYGQSFPGFIASFPPAASVPYLADVARLEKARRRAYHARDASPLDPARLEGLAHSHMEKLCFEPHPALFILRSPYAVFSIWQANCQDRPLKVSADTPEAALVCRPFLTVETHKLPAGADAFFSSLQKGEPLGAALKAGLAANPQFSLADSLTMALSSGAFTDFHVNE